MCPACVTTLALVAAGAGSAGGLAALIVKKVRGKPAVGSPEPVKESAASAADEVREDRP